VLHLAAEGERDSLRERLAHAGDLVLTEPDSGHLRDGEFAPDALFAMLDGWSRRKLITGDHPFDQPIPAGDPLCSPRVKGESAGTRPRKHPREGSLPWYSTRSG
jgi:hypothetical protein